MKKIWKRGFFCFLFLFVCIFSFMIVYAEDAPAETEEVTLNYCKEDKDTKKPDSESIITRFGIDLNATGGTGYILSMDCRETVTFTIVSVNDSTTEGNVNKTISCGEKLNLNIASSSDNTFGLPGATLKLTAVDVEKKPLKENEELCYWNSLSVDIYTTQIGNAIPSSVSYTRKEFTNAESVSTIIDCEHKRVTTNGTPVAIVEGSFEDHFCYAKEHASVKKDLGYNRYPTNESVNFKCSSKFNNDDALIPDNLTGNDYFVNKQYMYGKTKMKEEATLTKHYAPGNVGSSKISCEIECEESVEVEYGPPVATVAGVCFEYNVRATSYVACNMSKAPSTEGVCETKYCTPYPQCDHSGGVIYTQAGPSAQFDACVNKCDGGKYSKKCSNKCYKEVYGTPTAGAKINSIFGEVVATKVWDKQDGFHATDGFTCTGYHTYNKNATDTKYAIGWVGNDGGRWYCSSGWRNDRSWDNLDTFYATSDGFFRKLFDYGLCNATCYWTKCGENDYLNATIPSSMVSSAFSDIKSSDVASYTDKNGDFNVLQYDCAKNTDEYNRLVATCQSKATCNTETANFTISTEYTKLGSSDKVPIDFPYKSSADYITPSGDSSTSTSSANQPYSTLRPDLMEGLKGCYGAPVDNKTKYKATWGFPSSWMNLKTGEISYSSNGKLSGAGTASSVWYEHPHRFCVPNDAKGVNVLWYNAGMGRIVETKELTTEVSGTTYYDNCYSETTHSVYNSRELISTYFKTEGANVKYNIHAKAKKFGYLEWNIDVDCFYALNDDPICETYDNDTCQTSETTIKKYGCEPTDYRIHTVDLEDVFPDENGAEISDKSKASRSYVGYNWSQYAINHKNNDYVSNPVIYLANIQKNADTMYTDSNLDYEFYLSPKTIRAMRSQYTGSGANYTAFADSGFKKDETMGYARYQSSKIRSSDLFNGSNSKVPPKDSVAISCNNMVNWQTTSRCSEDHLKIRE